MSHRFEPTEGAIDDPKLRARVAAQSGFERPTVDALLTMATVRRFPRGSAIYPQGTHRGTLFIVLAGEVSLSVVLPNGQRILCALNQPGTIFGFPIVESERPRWSAAEAF